MHQGQGRRDQGAWGTVGEEDVGGGGTAAGDAVTWSLPISETRCVAGPQSLSACSVATTTSESRAKPPYVGVAASGVVESGADERMTTEAATWIAARRASVSRSPYAWRR